IASVDAAASTVDLDDVERRFLGKTSPLNDLRQAIKDVPSAERAAAGKAVSEARTAIEERVASRSALLAAREYDEAAVAERLDLTLPGRDYARGHLHPVTRIWRELEDVFVGLGYKVAEGPEVELDWYNFEALNFPPGHPARAMQDTLYVRLG